MRLRADALVFVKRCVLVHIVRASGSDAPRLCVGNVFYMLSNEISARESYRCCPQKYQQLVHSTLNILASKTTCKKSSVDPCAKKNFNLSYESGTLGGRAGVLDPLAEFDSKAGGEGLAL